MTTLRQAAEMALEALESNPISHAGLVNTKQAITALRAALKNEFNPDWDQVEALEESLREYMAEVQRLRAALAEPEQEPVAWMEMVVANLVREGVNKHKARQLAQHFTAPPQRKPLTDEEIRQIALNTPINGTNFARAIEAAHGIGEKHE